jgi:hypothetical protein
MTKKSLKNYSYLFFLFAFLFLAFFVSLLINGQIYEKTFMAILFLVLAFIQLRVGFMFRSKSMDANLD